MREKSSPKANDRRELLIEKAEELFARKGIDAVSLNEINKAAQQRNTSALHYYFGNKEGLIDAVIYHHYAILDRQIIEGLDAFEALPKSEQTPRRLMEVQLTPYADQLDNRRGINYLLIVSQVFMRSSEMILRPHPSGIEKARPRIAEHHKRLQPDFPKRVREMRQILIANLMFHSLASFAQISSNNGGLADEDKALFVSNLLDSLEALLLNPPSAETTALLD